MLTKQKACFEPGCKFNVSFIMQTIAVVKITFRFSRLKQRKSPSNNPARSVWDESRKLSYKKLRETRGCSMSKSIDIDSGNYLRLKDFVGIPQM
jgi:hypothetical protein